MLTRFNICLVTMALSNPPSIFPGEKRKAALMFLAQYVLCLYERLYYTRHLVTQSKQTPIRVRPFSSDWPNNSLVVQIITSEMLGRVLSQKPKPKQKDRRVGNEFCDLSLNKRKADTM